MNALKKILLPLFLATLLVACDNTSTNQTYPETKGETAILTAGDVRSQLFRSLKNSTGLAGCFDGNSLIESIAITGADAYGALEQVNLEKDSALIDYAAGLQKHPTVTKAVMVTTNGEQEQRYIYIPNDGSYGIEVNKDDETDIDLGVLVNISAFFENKQNQTCVTCTVESGKKGEGCTCTQTTKTVCCNTTGCSPFCGSTFQCKWDCNRDDAKGCLDLCGSMAPFEDPRPFASYPAGEQF